MLVFHVHHLAYDKTYAFSYPSIRRRRLVLQDAYNFTENPFAKFAAKFSDRSARRLTGV